MTIHHLQAKRGEDAYNTLEEDSTTMTFIRTEMLWSLFIVISMLDIGDIGKYIIHKILCDIQQKLYIEGIQQSMHNS